MKHFVIYQNSGRLRMTESGLAHAKSVLREEAFLLFRRGYTLTWQGDASVLASKQDKTLRLHIG